MGIIELTMLGFGLGMDAFAASVGKGLLLRKMEWKVAIVVGIYFGIFQALMPFLGYISGRSFGTIITSFSGWVTFFLLSFIGINMIRESLKNESKEDTCDLEVLPMILLSIATSIDAFAVGITFAFFEVNIMFAIFIIGTITFILSTMGVKIGNMFGSKYEKSAQILGGTILIVIGIKALLQQLGIL